MIHFFRDIISGPLYIITSILSIIFIMAIIGFMMERKKLEAEKKAQVAVISKKEPNLETNIEPAPIEPVSVVIEKQQTIEPQPLNSINSVSNNLEVKDPVIIFEDPDQKKE